MDHYQIFPAGKSDAVDYTAYTLQENGYNIASKPSESVTHLLLPVPSFLPDGSIRGGGTLEDILNQLPLDITIIGGNLTHPSLSEYKTVDLLQDPLYLAKNAMITAHCAIRLGMLHLPCTLENCPVLIIGWGRIGKCLSQLLQRLGSRVTVAARKETDRATLQSLGYPAIPPTAIYPEQYRLIYNTVPSMVLPFCPGNALKIDLASQPGMGGADVIWARGLPGKNAPESSGILIGQTIIDIFRKEQTK